MIANHVFEPAAAFAPQVVDGLAGCSRLEELHVSGQKLRRGMALTFDAPSMAAIGLTLTTLTAANCGLYACEELSLLTSLRRLDLTGEGATRLPEACAVFGVSLFRCLYCQTLDIICISRSALCIRPTRHQPQPLEE